MKKLCKRQKKYENSIEGYACNCYCGCGCSCSCFVIFFNSNSRSTDAENEGFSSTNSATGYSEAAE